MAAPRMASPDHAADRPAAPPGAEDRAAQVAALFREHNRTLVAFLQARLNSRSDAQELAQEVYVRMLTMKDADPIAAPRALLFRIAANLAVDRLRMRAVRANAPADAPDDDWFAQPIPEQHASALEQWREVRAALRELPAKTSKAFVMHVIEGRDFSAIAQTMKLSERMVRYHVSNALAHCRTRLQAAEPQATETTP
jgi:RNA polymerase sigma-70 factor (ECF subfamily)